MYRQKLAYSKDEAAQATSLSKRTIDYLIKEGKLEGVKIGKRLLIPTDELERLLKTKV